MRPLLAKDDDRLKMILPVCISSNFTGNLLSSRRPVTFLSTAPYLHSPICLLQTYTKTIHYIFNVS